MEKYQVKHCPHCGSDEIMASPVTYDVVKCPACDAVFEVNFDRDWLLKEVAFND